MLDQIVGPTCRQQLDSHARYKQHCKLPFVYTPSPHFRLFDKLIIRLNIYKYRSIKITLHNTYEFNVVVGTHALQLLLILYLSFRASQYI